MKEVALRIVILSMMLHRVVFLLIVVGDWLAVDVVVVVAVMVVAVVRTVVFMGGSVLVVDLWAVHVSITAVLVVVQVVILDFVRSMRRLQIVVLMLELLLLLLVIGSGLLLLLLLDVVCWMV